MSDKHHLSSMDHLQFHLKWGYEWCMPPNWRLERVNRYPFFWLLLKGKMEITYGGSTFILEPHQLLSGEAFEPLLAQGVSDRPLVFMSIGYEATLFRSSLTEWLGIPVICSLSEDDTLHATWRELIRQLDELQGMHTSQKEEPIQELLVLSLQFTWLYQLLRHLPLLPSGRGLTRDSRVIQACRYIQEHLTEPLSTNCIAESVYVSPNYFAALFKSELGISPAQYVRHKRLRRAQELLLSGSDPVSEIGAQTGFKDPSEFSRIFRKQFKLSPTQYRAKWRSTSLGESSGSD